MSDSRTPATSSPRRRALVSVISIICLVGGALALITPWSTEQAEAASRPEQRPAPPPQPRSSASEPHWNQAARGPSSSEGVDSGAPGDADSLSLGLFDKVTLSPDNARRLHDATEASLVSCMHERGLQYLANTWLTEEEQADAGGIGDRPRGDVEEARARGYGLADAVQARETPPPDANREYVEQLPADAQRAWREALAGPPIEPIGPPGGPDIGTVSVPGGPMVQWNRDSCLARAQRGVYGDDVTHTQLTMMVEVLREDVDERALADPQYRAGVERWRTCMSSRGMSYSEPAAAVGALVEEVQSGKLAGEQLRRREIEVATADAECSKEVNLASLSDAAHARAEVVVERASRDLLESMIALQTGALERADRSGPR